MTAPNDTRRDAATVLSDARGLMRTPDGGARQSFGFTEEMLQRLDAVSEGKPVRGASLVLQAAKVRIDALKAAGVVAQQAGVQYVVDPFQYCPSCGVHLPSAEEEAEAKRKATVPAP